MIPVVKVKSIVEAIKTATGLTTIRANQMVKMPNYPYVTYNVINSSQEHPIRNIKSRAYSSQLQETTNTTNQDVEETISLNVYSDKYDEAKEKSHSLYIAFKNSSFLESLNTLEVVAYLRSTQIQDRTILKEANYEYRFGFDVMLKTNVPLSEIFESIEHVSGKINIEKENGIIEENPYEVN